MGKKKRKKGNIFKRRKKNAFMDNFHFGKASICVIFSSVFLSAVVIGTCVMSQSSLERYAKINVAEAKDILEEFSRNGGYYGKKVARGIIIGRGVFLSDSCRVSRTSIICE